MNLKPLLLLLLLFASACCKPHKQEKSSFKQSLRLNLASDPVSLDPRVVQSVKDLTVVRHLFEGLMRIDSEGIPRPAIAKEVKISDDLLTYTFKLRKAHWSNGDFVTAHDFKYAWSKALDPSFASNYSYMLYPIKNAKSAREGKGSIDQIGITAVDDYTLVVELETPTPYFPELTAFPTYYPLNHKTDYEFNTSQGQQFVSNGPFKLKYWKANAELCLEKNLTYWDAARVGLDLLVFSVIADTLTESHLFEKQQLDWLGQPTSHNITTDMIGKMKEENRLQSYNIAGTFWFKFNTNETPFDHRKMRCVFSYALDRQAIIEHILQGNQTMATGPLPPSMVLNEGPYFENDNRELARKLFNEALTESGYTLATFPKVVLSYPPSERNTKIVQLVQQQWKNRLGVEIKLMAVENQLYRSQLKRGLFQIGTGDWIADFNDPLAFLELFKYRNDAETGNGMNDTGWQDKQYIALLDRSLVEKDTLKRREILHQAEKILVSEMPIAPVYHHAFDYIKKSYVENVILSPLGGADFKYARINLSQK